MDLLRVDFTNDNNESINSLSGSILFLEPNTLYEVQLSLSDPDGTSSFQVSEIRTRAVPSLPTSGRTFYVAPGSGGGNGSQASPFRGIETAQNLAQAGDIFILTNGTYGSGNRVLFDKSGAENNYIVWKAQNRGSASFPGGLRVQGDHLWFEGISVSNTDNALLTYSAPEDVVVTRCTFTNNHYSVRLNHGGSGWYITDNIIVGDTLPSSGSLSGEGVELEHSSNHVVAFNSISNVADAVSYPGRNVDIYNNDMFDLSDDGIEFDYGYANNRAWQNRIHNAYHNGVSFQPLHSAPVYVLRNQIIGNAESPVKFRTTDRFVMLHNTFVKHGQMISSNQHHLLRGIVKNNLWIQLSAGRMLRFDTGSDWRTLLDYNGYDWEGTHPFRYLGTDYFSLGTFASGSGLENSGVEIDRSVCFPTLSVPGEPPTSVPAQHLVPTSGCTAVNAGDRIPNINQNYQGSGPDMGAYERGAELPTYGPRTTSSSTPNAPRNLRIN
jgi:hypothetical protein